MRPRLTGLTFCFTGDFYKDPAWQYRGEPLTKEQFAQIIVREGGTMLPQVSPQLNYLIRLGHNYPATLRREIDEMNYEGQTHIVQIELREFFEQLLSPSRDECLELLKAGPAGAARFTELREYFPGHCVDLSGADLQNQDLPGVLFRSTKIDGVDFRGTNLTGAIFSSAYNLQLDEANLSGAEVHSISDSSLVAANLTGATEVRLARCNLSQATLAEAQIENLSQCQLQGANLDGTKWKVYHMWGGNEFGGATLRNAWVILGDFLDSSLQGTNLENTKFHQCKMEGIDLSNTNCRGAEFGYVDLRGANVSGADFTGATLRMCNLEGVDTSSANGLAEAIIAPRGKIGPCVRELERMCHESKRIAFQGWAETETRRIEFELQFDQRSSAPPCRGVWHLHDKATPDARPVFTHFLVGVAAPAYTQYFMDIAGYWTDATVQWKSIKVSSSKAPLKGKELKEVVIAALAEAWGQTPP